MGRRKKIYSRTTNGCLSVALLLLISGSGWSAPFKLGTITQAQGEITHLDFTPPEHKLTHVKKGSTFFTEGSYLTQDESYLTVQLFEGSWLRLSPGSKISSEYDPEAKQITLHLFTGSIKVLFSIGINHLQVEKLVVKSADALFETVDAKFTVVRSPITDSSSVYVEKGAVLAQHGSQKNAFASTLIHAQETTSLTDRENRFASARKMTEKELKYLHPSQYIKKRPQ